MSPPTQSFTEEDLEDKVYTYFEGCTEADAEKITSCLTPDCVHYFPPGPFDTPFHGAEVIAEKWIEAVHRFDSSWTVDTIVVHPEQLMGAIEWTNFWPGENKVIRGSEWYDFHPDSGRIQEIRAYYASPLDLSLDHNELEAFDYRARGYPVSPSDTDPS